MQETLIREKYNPEGISKSNWKIDFKMSSSPSSFSTLSLITNLPDNKAEETKKSQNAVSLEELKWRYNLNLNKGKPIKIQNADTIIQSVAAKLGCWGSNARE